MIYEVYLFDPLRRVYLCEMTPSYECYMLGAQVDYHDCANVTEDEMEAVEDWIRQNEDWSQLVTYFHCHLIDSNAKPLKEGWIPKHFMGVTRMWGASLRTSRAMKPIPKNTRMNEPLPLSRKRRNTVQRMEYEMNLSIKNIFKHFVLNQRGGCSNCGGTNKRGGLFEYHLRPSNDTYGPGDQIMNGGMCQHF